MNATVPLNRVGAHFDSAPTSKLALPQGERARGQLWSDAVFEAVQALRIQLHSRSEPIAAAAANSILELERTRMRHDKCLAGSRNLNEDQDEFERNPTCAEDDDDDDHELDEELTARGDQFPTGRQAGRVENPSPSETLVDELETRRHEVSAEPEAADENNFENHTRTVRNYFASVLGRPMTVQESEEYVSEKLRGYMLTANCVPRDKFINQMRFWGDMPGQSRAE